MENLINGGTSLKNELNLKSEKSDENHFTHLFLLTAESSLKERDNFDFVMNSVILDGLTLQYASERLRNNIDIALSAILCDKNAYSFLSKELQEDVEVIFASKGELTASLKLRKRADLITIYQLIVKEELPLSMLSKNYIDMFTKDNKYYEYILKGLINEPSDFSLLSEEFRKDPDTIYYLASTDINMLDYAHESLREDKDFVYEVIKSHLCKFKNELDDFKRMDIAVNNPGYSRKGKEMLYQVFSLDEKYFKDERVKTLYDILIN